MTVSAAREFTSSLHQLQLGSCFMPTLPTAYSWLGKLVPRLTIGSRYSRTQGLNHDLLALQVLGLKRQLCSEIGFVSYGRI